MKYFRQKFSEFIEGHPVLVNTTALGSIRKEIQFRRVKNKLLTAFLIEVLLRLNLFLKAIQITEKFNKKNKISKKCQINFQRLSLYSRNLYSCENVKHKINNISFKWCTYDTITRIKEKIHLLPTLAEKKILLNVFIFITTNPLSSS